jgi:hypothetical protein
MPFDGKVPAPDITNTPNLEVLSYVLRHRELWPDGFKWDYTSCLTCAFGMASKIWRNIHWPPADFLGTASSLFSLRRDDAAGIFVTASLEPNVLWSSVTPEHVADAIDTYLATK